MGITIRVTGLYRDDRIMSPVLLVEADLMHINVYSLLHNIGPVSLKSCVDVLQIPCHE